MDSEPKTPAPVNRDPSMTPDSAPANLRKMEEALTVEAMQELEQGMRVEDGDDPAGLPAATRDPSEPLDFNDGAAPRVQADDEETVLERTAETGRELAADEQAEAARSVRET